MAYSKVQIANRALQKLGAERIESFSQDHPNARTINAAYDLVRDAELRRHAWTFAVSRASIAADGDDSLWGGWNRYSKPNDFLRLIRDDETGSSVDFKLEGNYILSANASPLEIRYVARIDDPNTYDALFVEAFASKLAYECCEDITGSITRQQAAEDDYDRAIREAKRIDAFEKEEEAGEEPEDDWIAGMR